MKKTVDYQKLRGFNYTQPDAVNDRDFWANYHHDIVDRDMGYAERLHLNSARIFSAMILQGKSRQVPCQRKGFCTDGMETWHFYKPYYFYGVPVPGG